MDEVIENEYNLNLPRYIDTVKPERQIPIEEAKSELEQAILEEAKAEEELKGLLKLLKKSS